MTETIDDILREMREWSKTATFASRLEAALKREREAHEAQYTEAMLGMESLEAENKRLREAMLKVTTRMQLWAGGFGTQEKLAEWAARLRAAVGGKP